MSTTMQKRVPAGAVPLASPGPHINNAHAGPCRAHRKELVTSGFVGIPGLRLRAPCTVLNISATGARLVLLPSRSRIQLAEHLPDQIAIVLPSDGVEVSGVIRWRKREQFGVQLTSAFRRLII